MLEKTQATLHRHDHDYGPEKRQSDELMNGGTRKPMHGGEHMTHHGRVKNNPGDNLPGEEFRRDGTY